MRSIVKTLVAVFFVVGATPAFAAPVTAHAPDGAKQPAAHFDHEKHGIKQTGNRDAGDCKKCHDAVKEAKAGDMKNSAHGVCLDCHKGEGKAKGAPQACNACHVKA